MFKNILSPETRARLEAEEQEALRLYGLGDRWLADALLKLARSARLGMRWGPHDPVYDSTFVWHVIPEIAKRLGAQNFLPEERGDYRIKAATDAELRERAMGCISHSDPFRNIANARWTMLLREPANGNPVVYAVDRLCPGDLSQPDTLVKRLREIAGYRGVEYDGRWTPAMMT